MLCSRCTIDFDPDVTPGGLLFDPPDADGMCLKRHVCRRCWPLVLGPVTREEATLRYLTARGGTITELPMVHEWGRPPEWEVNLGRVRLPIDDPLALEIMRRAGWDVEPNAEAGGFTLWNPPRWERPDADLPNPPRRRRRRDEWGL